MQLTRIERLVHGQVRAVSVKYGGQVAEPSNMSEGPDDFKLERFERLWRGWSPKGENRTKALKFRHYMRQHVLQALPKRRKVGNKERFLNKENCRKYWMGELQQEIADAENF